jgi:flavin-dependent dehydrogenase
MIDLIVAGGGPIGLATALYARRSGLTVTVVEPRRDAIDKACGEGLMPDAVARLAALGVDPPGLAFRGIRYLDRTHSAEARFRGSPGRGVRRTTLHTALRERADDAGVCFVDGRVTSVDQSAQHVDAAGIRGRYLVAADGLHSTVRTSLGLARSTGGRKRFGVRRHFHVEPWSDLVEVHWLPRAEVYVTPVADDVVGVAVLGGRPLSLEHAIAAAPGLARRLASAVPASDERGAGPLRQGTQARTAGRVLLVGDAAGYIDAITGEGLRVGLAEAQAAVRAVEHDDVLGYESEWRHITRSYRCLTESLLWVSGQPALRPLIVPAASAIPFAFRQVVRSLGA